MSIYLHTKKLHKNIFTIEKRLRKAFLKAILIGENKLYYYYRGIVYATNWIIGLFTKFIVQVFFECGIKIKMLRECRICGCFYYYY